jgi:uncharacterized protein (TIGR02271 family)
MPKGRDPNGDLSNATDSETILPLIAEEVEVSKRIKETGRVRVSKRVRHNTATVDELLKTETYEVKRVPMNRTVDAPIEPRHEGDTLIISILEEQLVVEKRLVLVEELHIVRNVQNKPERQEIELRREEAEIERIPADEA